MVKVMRDRITGEERVVVEKNRQSESLQDLMNAIVKLCGPGAHLSHRYRPK